jgi:phospholipase C
VRHGEKLIAAVYNALVSNPCVFERSLLLIVYDEHGGFYDHVIPPGHAGWTDKYPGIVHEVVPPDDAVGDADGHERGYDFTTLGPRVPAVVVSPWIERGSVFGWKASDPARRATFDHTSILATVAGLTGAQVDSKRARAATSLDVTLNRSSPRKEYPTQLIYQPRDYFGGGIVDEAAHPNAGDEWAGIAGDLREAFRAKHGEATPTEITAHYQKLLG